MVQLRLVQNLVIRWHHLHCLQSWPPGCITALPHCLELPYWHYQLVLSWYLHQPESHKLSLTNVCEFQRLEPIDRTPGIPGPDKNIKKRWEWEVNDPEADEDPPPTRGRPRWDCWADQRGQRGTGGHFKLVHIQDWSFVIRICVHTGDDHPAKCDRLNGGEILKCTAYIEYFV